MAAVSTVLPKKQAYTTHEIDLWFFGRIAGWAVLDCSDFCIFIDFPPFAFDWATKSRNGRSDVVSTASIAVANLISSPQIQEERKMEFNFSKMIPRGTPMDQYQQKLLLMLLKYRFCEAPKTPSCNGSCEMGRIWYIKMRNTANLVR